MTSFSPLISAPPLEGNAAHELLHALVSRSGELAERALMVFDLDSTLLDNSPRQARIMRDYGKDHGVAALETVGADHWKGWDAKVPMRAVGLAPDEVDVHFDAFRAYWWERFFVSDFCELDRPLPGAVAYAQAVAATGARLHYVTGRHEAMRSGTLACFERHKLPIPGGRVELVMKPSLDESDDAYKNRTYEALRGAGQLVGAFDNEPAHINGYFEAFPDGQAVHLATDHSLREIPVHSDIPSIRDFSDWSG